MTSFIDTRHFLAITLGVCLALTYAPGTAFAKEVGIRLTPSSIQIHPQKDGMVEKTITVENSGHDPLELEVQIRAFTTDKKGGILYVPEANLDEKTRELITNDIQLLENSIVVESLSLAPGQKEDLDLSINIKDIQNISQYTFSIFFISNNTRSETQTNEESPIQTELNVSVGSAIHVIVFGKKNAGEEQIVISSFQTDRFIQNGPVSFMVKAKNGINEYINIYGNITITNMFNQQIGTIRIPNQLLAGTSEKTLSGQGLGGSNDAIVWSDKLLLGNYTAIATLSTNNGTSTIARTSFFAFPIRTAILTLIAFLIASFVIGQVRERVK